jgi:hypothetical protein
VSRRTPSRRRTKLLGALALTTAGILGVVESRHLRRGALAQSGRAGDHQPASTTREALAVVREGYHAGSARENAVFNVLVAFTATFGVARAITYLIRADAGPFGNVVIGRRHIHHFVPGILLALVAGGMSIGIRREEIDKWLAVPFGVGAALVFDESALLLELEDVYWSDRGIVSVQFTFAAASVIATLGLAVRLVRRGEPNVRQARPPATRPSMIEPVQP